MRAHPLVVPVLALLLGCSDPAPAPAAEQPLSPRAAAPKPSAAREDFPDVSYVPTPQPVVDAMLKLGEVKKGDVVYDLGSGDGRIPITAAKRYGVRAVGIEIQSYLVKDARAAARKAGVSHLVDIRQADLFESDYREASVVTLYLLSSLNEKLRPKLLAELKPGSRIVSHSFRMGDWEPEKTEMVGGSVIYLWRVPAKATPDG